ncbi:ATP-dependent bile acid permease [Pleurostoma richardsiae]|uniref:ATP-dependent bile acid permease n=1 Tax=Pleurostoma richardsiae TaxID=41990 RepID=A0AA38RV16_9PEZI|nr:ATP-dependent bile acid permease [Pleurostoma richardsiae]
MSPGRDILQAAAAGAGVCLVVGLTVPSAVNALRRRRAYKSRGYDSVSGFYEDEDGEATEKSTLDYSDARPRVAAWLSATVGLAAAVAAGVLANQRATLSSAAVSVVLSLLCSWSDVLAWLLVFVQCSCLPGRGQYRDKYRLSLYGVASSLVLAASLICRSRLSALVHRSHDAKELGLGLCWLLEVIAAVSAAFALALIPRRPDVFHRGSLVDQQHTVSLLSKLSFSWNRVMFDVSRERQLEMRDLPQLDGVTRSSNLHARFVSSSSSGDAKGSGARLWWRLVRAHYVPLLQQWSLVLLSSLLALFPQYVLYNFLERLETRSGPSRGDASAVWAWALALCLALALQVVVSGVLGWWTNSQLVLPVQGILQSLVFNKALNQHETAAPGQKTEDEGKDDKGASEQKPKGKEQDKTRQSVINHMKLDSGRVTMFCSFNYYFPLAVVKLVLAGGFLIRLLGWKAVVAGLLSAAAVVPISSWMSKKYGKIQFGLMKYRDGKAHLLTEALQGMRQIKYSALEQHWEDKIMKSRNEELRQYWKVSLMMCAVILIVNMGPLLLACVALSVYALAEGSNVRASVIFASLGLFDQLDEVTAFLPILQVYMTEAWTSCVRLEKYLNQPDRAPVAIKGESIRFEDATVAWPRVEETEEDEAEPQDPRSMLKDVSLEFPVDKLSVIAGKTGAGKSLLLAAILGEVKLLSGTVRVPHPPPEDSLQAEQIPGHEWIVPSLTSFVSQTPWIETGTVRDNIIFGLPFNEVRYRKALKACSLEKDVELLVDGDETEVGPKGVTLSGGQRWRVALARALYSRAGILILDDVLSAVDAHVGRCVVDEALSGELARGRTRILATHHAEMCLSKASYLVRLHDGKVESTETLDGSDDEDARSEAAESSLKDFSETATTVDAQESQTSDETIVNPEGSETSGKKMEDEEKRETGRVKWKIYQAYLKASNAPLLWTLSIVLIIGSGLANLGRAWSLKELAEGNSTAEEPTFHAYTRVHETQLYLHNPKMQLQATQQHSPTFWIAASVVFYLLNIGLLVGRDFTMVIIGLKASRALFERMTHAILRAPLRWVDTVPAGRILNRFTSDTFMVDRRLPSDLGGFLSTSFSLLVVIGASLSVSPYVIICGVLLLLLYARIASEYITVAREVKRLNSISHSPIYDQFSSVLSGLSTIRAFNRTNFYMNRMFDLIDNSAKASWALSLSGRWMNFRMGMLGTVFVTAVAVAVSVGSVDAALAGFSLTFALRYTGRLTALLQSMTSIELDFNAAERVVEYAEIETEPEGGADAPAAWPTEGRIEVDNVTVAYKEDLPPVLKDLNFTVAPGERIGIVGRTGAGKSTLAAVLFRLLEPREGAVRIDGIDIATLKLKDLRGRLAIIPQDPFLFSGTLRSNLDMEGLRDDYDLQATLQRVHLVEPQSADPSRPSQYPVTAAAEVPIVSTSEANPPAAAEDATTVSAVGDTLNSASAPTTTSNTVSEAAPQDDTDSSGGGSNSTNIFSNLSMEISTGGANLSQGQRQLVCLARALLARPKIVVLDEATSAVDRGTDAAIQASLRAEFAAAGCTVLVIAHRLSTVADFDRVLVLREGRVAEMGTPAELVRRGIERERKAAEVGEGEGREAEGGGEEDDGVGAFWELVKKSAEREKLVEMVLGKEEV